MNKLNYELDTADECVRLISSIISDYNKIYRDIDASLTSISGTWQGDASAMFREKSDALLTNMRLTELEINELYRLALGKTQHVRTLENKVFRSIIGSGEQP